jgi:two-component system chemotaxis sensor kinase CheA
MSDAFDGFLTDFALDAQERCDRLEELLLSAIDSDAAPDVLEEIRRELHTLKGNAGMVGLRELQEAAHVIEDKVTRAARAEDFRELLHDIDDFRTSLNAVSRGQGAGGRNGELRSVRVPFSALDELVDLLAEMVVFRNRLDDAIVRGTGVAEAHEALSKTLSFLQDHIMAMRMVPLRMLFGQLRRIVHDEAAAAGKEARLVAAGGETPMDKALLESAGDALGHLVRNAVTHGIESPARRIAAGKRSEGLVQISAITHSDEVWIEVRDDGAGIDPVAIAAAAAEKGISLEGVRDPLQFLFRSGFSTRADSDISAGRGVGLSAALEAVRRVGGDIDLESAPGQGARFRMRLPLTLSITRALLVGVDGEEYAVPLASIVESIRVADGDVHLVNDAAVFNWRGRVVPLLDLGLVMASANALRARGYIVVLEADGRNRGLLVDELIGMREIVVKGLGDIGAPPPGISGATILGDGRVLLIADPKSLISVSPLLHSGVAA